MKEAYMCIPYMWLVPLGINVPAPISDPICEIIFCVGSAYPVCLSKQCWLTCSILGSGCHIYLLLFSVLLSKFLKFHCWVIGFLLVCLLGFGSHTTMLRHYCCFCICDHSWWAWGAILNAGNRTRLAKCKASTYALYYACSPIVALLCLIHIETLKMFAKVGKIYFVSYNMVWGSPVLHILPNSRLCVTIRVNEKELLVVDYLSHLL